MYENASTALQQHQLARPTGRRFFHTHALSEPSSSDMNVTCIQRIVCLAELHDPEGI